MIRIRIITIAAAAIFFAVFPVFARDAAVSHALALPVKDALRVMDSLSRAQGAPRAARAESLRFLGDYQFTKGNYGAAADFYKRASELDTLPLYRELHSVSIAAAGGGTAVVVAPPVSQQPAAPVNQPTAPAVQQTPPVTPPAAQQTPPAAPVAQQPPPAAPSGDKTVFTVQVGAFGSKENADNLVNRLAGTFNDITISPTTSGDQTLFRVRIGSFENREDAAAFADRLITTSGLSARVVEK
jgi:cell division septation protein DedD